MKVKQNDQEYNRYVEAITPKHSCFKNCLHAFLVGGCICLLGQVIFNVCTTQFHYEEADAMSVCSILLVFLSSAVNLFLNTNVAIAIAIGGTIPPTITAAMML